MMEWKPLTIDSEEKAHIQEILAAAQELAKRYNLNMFIVVQGNTVGQVAHEHHIDLREDACMEHWRTQENWQLRYGYDSAIISDTRRDGK